MHIDTRKVDVTRLHIEQGGVAQQQLPRILAAIEDLESVQIRPHGERIDASEIETLVDRRTLPSRGPHRLMLKQVFLQSCRSSAPEPQRPSGVAPR